MQELPFMFVAPDEDLGGNFGNGIQIPSGTKSLPACPRLDFDFRDMAARTRGGLIRLAGATVRTTTDQTEWRFVIVLMSAGCRCLFFVWVVATRSLNLNHGAIVPIEDSGPMISLSPSRLWMYCASAGGRAGGVFVLILAATLMPSTVRAAEGVSTVHPPVGLKWIDWIVIAIYMVTVLLLGSFYSKRQSNNAEYFIAARTHIEPFMVGISLYASLLSTISYLGKPGEMINKGPVVLIGQILSIPFAYFIVSYWIIPKFMRQRVTSAYELLESRLGVTGRMLGAILFVKLRLVWMGLLVYVSATALAVIVDIDLKWVPLVSCLVGVIPLVYTSMGGLRAVVVANVIQFFLLFLGAVVTIAVITFRCGGFSWWPTAWSPHWDTQPFFSLDPQIRVTVLGATFSTVIWRVCTAGGDQMAIQHYMATRDVAATRRSYLVTSIATVAVTMLLAILGLALLGFFTRFPEMLGPGMSLEKSADHLFPYFVANLLPVGVSGLVVAAIIAASSGMDTGVNAVTAVVMKDFFERFGWRPEGEAHRLKVTKAISFGIGFAVIGASLLMHRVPGNFLEMTNKLANLEATTIFGLFFLALYVRCATPLGAVFGAIYGLTASVLVAFWDVMTGRPAISFLYIGVIGLFVNLAVGYLVSRFGPRRENIRKNFRVGALLFVVLVAAFSGLVGWGR